MEDLEPPRARDALGLAFFTVAWLLPLLYHGFNGGERMPGYPARLVHLTNVSCLFVYSVPAWQWFYAQVQPRAGADWSTLPEREYFRMRAFGYHSRLDEVARRNLGEPAIAEMTHWIWLRYQQLNPGQPPPAAVRIVGGLFRVGEPIPRGHWRKPPFESLDDRHRFLWYLRTYDGAAGLAGAPSTRP